MGTVPALRPAGRGAAHRLQPEVAQSWVAVRATSLWPVEETLRLGDGQVVDAGVAPAHQTALVELPVLVAVGAEPVAGVVTGFVGEADGDAVAFEGPQFLDQPVLQLPPPLAGQEGHDLVPPGDEL